MSNLSNVSKFFRNLATQSPRKRRQAAAGTPIAGMFRSAESLERRDLMSVSQIFFSGSTLVFKTDNNATDLNIKAVGSNYVVRDNTVGTTWTYAASKVTAIQFQGGAGNDRFTNGVSNLRMEAWGNGGNDYLEGYNAADYFDGGAGNDTIKGYGGNDLAFGGAGDDVLLGMDGNDELQGGDGNDQLNGGAGTDKLFGQNGDDVIVALDNVLGDYVDGGAGSDALWVDLNGSSSDTVYGATSADKVQNVASFANGADRTLDRDAIADPTAAAGFVYKRFSDNPLFGSSGPRVNDIKQGAIGDCYFLAGIGAIAEDKPLVLRQNIVDFNDGTYGVRLGNKFYRVDADLAVSSASSSTPAYAALGAGNAMWVAIAEKAFAYYRTGANTYASIANGWSTEAYTAFGASSTGWKDIQTYASSTALANDMFSKWNGYQSLTIGFLGVKAGGTGTASLVMGHMYTVTNVIRNSAGVVTSIVLRNPWGVDGAGNDGNNDGYVTVTPAQLMQYTGRTNWGTV